MAFNETIFMDSMTAEQRMIFMSQYNAVRKSNTTGVLLAVFLGGIGVHHFYLSRIGLGIVYLFFAWTLIPAMIGLVEAFFMSDRVDRHNQQRALDIATRVKMLGPGAPVS